MSMRRFLMATGAAALLSIAVVATVAAAGPHGRAGVAERAGGQSNVIAETLGLTRDAIEDLRHKGLSLAAIAEQQKVDEQKLVDALAARWLDRIDARVTAGALDAADATALKDQVGTRALEMVERTELGGMRGAAVGAGPGSSTRGAGNGGAGRGAGNGACDGSGPVAQP
jgi:prolyl-tRNA editing enzyme YbaK/EbsC (Cys-tRNA(Pro) deacylase)